MIAYDERRGRGWRSCGVSWGSGGRCCWHFAASGHDRRRRPARSLCCSALRLTRKQPPVETPGTAQKPNGPSRIEVKGSEEAEAGGELRNPFSMLHETRAEMAAASQSAKEATPQASEKDETANAKAAKQSALPAAKTSASAVEDMGAAEPQAPALVLKGVASGNGETVAVIRAEGKSKIVTEGENVGGYTVAAIDGDSVTLMGDGGTMVLQLAH